jgi:hypothetical protein
VGAQVIAITFRLVSRHEIAPLFVEAEFLIGILLITSRRMNSD